MKNANALTTLDLPDALAPNKVQHLFKEIAESSPMPNVASPISAFLSLKAVATDLITLKLIRIFQFTSILSIFVNDIQKH